MSKGNLYIVSGPSGAGKSSVLDIVFSKMENVFFSVSVTTREKRPGEIDGAHYHFIDRDKFERLVDGDELLECAEFVGNMYGTPKEPVLEKIRAGKDIIMDIELRGVKQVKEKMPEAVSIFLIPPTMEELEKRLVGRGTDTPEKISGRIEAAKRDCAEASLFDYIVVNSDVEKAACEIMAIITAERCRSENMMGHMEEGRFIPLNRI